MRFRADEDDAAPLELELGDSSDFGAEVSFRGGPGRSSGPSNRLLVGGLVALAAAVGTAVWLGGGGNDAAAPSTTAALPTAPPTTIAARRTSVPRPSTTTTVEEPYVPFPAFATDPGYRVYVSSNQSGIPYSFDLTTGVLDRFDDGESGLQGVVSGPDGPVPVTWGPEGLPGLVGDGTAWYFDGADLVRRSLGADRTELERVTNPASFTQFSGRIGTTAEGRPVVQLADAQDYVVAPDGSLSRFADGVLTNLRAGQYGLSTCTGSGDCTLLLHGSAGELTIPAPSSWVITVDVSPTGSAAAVVLSTDTGQSVELYDLSGQFEPAVLDVGADFYSYGADAGTSWSPDGRYYFFAGRSRLNLVDAESFQVVELSGDLPGTFTVAGVA